MLQQGEHEQVVIKQCLREKRPLPKKIANAPELWFGLEMYMQAFWDLDTTRPISGDGFHPISWHQINRWSKDWDLDQDQHESLHFIIRKLDNEYLKFKQSKVAKPKGKFSLLNKWKNG